MTTLRVLCKKWRHGRVIAIAVTLLALSMPAVAQPPPAAKQQPSITVEAQPGATESQLYRWIAKTADEPETLVYQGEKRVASGQNGKRIVLAPGSYVLRIGSSPLNQMMSVPVDVTAGNTKLVPVTWGGIIVEVVDKNNVPIAVPTS